MLTCNDYLVNNRIKHSNIPSRLLFHSTTTNLISVLSTVTRVIAILIEFKFRLEKWFFYLQHSNLLRQRLGQLGFLAPTRPSTCCWSLYQHQNNFIHFLDQYSVKSRIHHLSIARLSLFIYPKEHKRPKCQCLSLPHLAGNCIKIDECTWSNKEA